MIFINNKNQEKLSNDSYRKMDSELLIPLVVIFVLIVVFMFHNKNKKKKVNAVDTDSKVAVSTINKAVVETSVVVKQPVVVEDIDCVQEQWGICDPETYTQTRKTTVEPVGNGAKCGPLTRKCAPNPKLLNDKIQWQYNCEDCGGLVWTSVGSSPWNRYYKVSCQNGEGESELTQAFGPVGNNMYNNPMLRISDDWKNKTCNGFQTNIYRSKALDGKYHKLDPSKLTQFWSSNPVWEDENQGRFIDNDNSTEY